MKLRLALILLFLCGLSLAQTVVTGTIVDPNGNPYANGTASAYTVAGTGQATQYTSPVATSAAGFFTLTIQPNVYIFTICAPPTQIGPLGNPTPTQVCFTSSPIVISGSALDISAQLNPLAIVIGPSGSGMGGGINTSAVLVNPSAPTQNVITPSNPTTQGLTINAPTGGAFNLDTLQVNDPSGNQVFAVDGNNDTVQIGNNSQGPATVNFAGGINSAFELSPDPYCVNYSQTGQVQICNLNGLIVFGQGGTQGQNYAPVLFPAQDYQNQQPFPNGWIPQTAAGGFLVQAPPIWNQNTTGTAGNLSGSPTLPSGVLASSGIPLANMPCSVHYRPIAGLSDQLTSAGTFATTASIAPTCLGVGAKLDIRAHGVLTTTGTASPQLNFQVNAGGTAGICPGVGSSITLSLNVTAKSWDLACVIQVNTMGAPGSSIAWGTWATPTSTGQVGATEFFNNSSTVSYNTSASQTLSIQETGVFVTGQTINLHALDIVVTQ